MFVCAPAAFAEEGYRRNPNPPTDGLVGSNYTPAYAVNQVQFNAPVFTIPIEVLVTTTAGDSLLRLPASDVN